MFLSCGATSVTTSLPSTLICKLFESANAIPAVKSMILVATINETHILFDLFIWLCLLSNSFIPSIWVCHLVLIHFLPYLYNDLKSGFTTRFWKIFLNFSFRLFHNKNPPYFMFLYIERTRRIFCDTFFENIFYFSRFFDTICYFYCFFNGLVHSDFNC